MHVNEKEIVADHRLTRKRLNCSDWWQPTSEQILRYERLKPILDQRCIPRLWYPTYVVDAERFDRVLRKPFEIQARLHAMWHVFRQTQGESIERCRDRLEVAKFWTALTEKERNFLAQDEPEPEQAASLYWRVEGAWLLLWSLGGVSEIGWPSDPCDLATMNDRISAVVAEGQPTIRPTCELLDEFQLTMQLGWAISEALLEQKELPVNLDWASSSARTTADKCIAAEVVKQRLVALNWISSYADLDWDVMPTC